MSQKLLTRADVAQLLSISLRSVDRLRSHGLLPAIKVLTTVRFKEEDASALLDRQRAGR